MDCIVVDLRALVRNTRRTMRRLRLRSDPDGVAVRCLEAVGRVRTVLLVDCNESDSLSVLKLRDGVRAARINVCVHRLKELLFLFSTAADSSTCVGVW